MTNYSTENGISNNGNNSQPPQEDSKFKKFVKKVFAKIKSLFEILLLYLEIHFAKIMLFTLFSLMVTNVQVLNIFLVFISIVSLIFHRGVQIFIAKFCALICAVLLVGNMVYQLEFVHHEMFEVNCTVSIWTQN